MSDPGGRYEAGRVAETPAEMVQVLREAAEGYDTIVVHGADGTSIECILDGLLEDKPLAAESDYDVIPPHGDISGIVLTDYVIEHLDADEARVIVREGESGGWEHAELEWGRGLAEDGGYEEFYIEKVERIEVVNDE